MLAVEAFPKLEVMAPGATTVTWTPNGANSRRKASDMECTAALDIEYTPIIIQFAF